MGDDRRKAVLCTGQLSSDPYGSRQRSPYVCHDAIAKAHVVLVLGRPQSLVSFPKEQGKLLPAATVEVLTWSCRQLCQFPAGSCEDLEGQEALELLQAVVEPSVLHTILKLNSSHRDDAIEPFIRVGQRVDEVRHSRHPPFAVEHFQFAIFRVRKLFREAIAHGDLDHEGELGLQ